VRNHYDRIGHFAQGFVPAIAAREVLIRVARYRRDSWLNVVIFSICLAISATYEFVEWWTALLSGRVPPGNWTTSGCEGTAARGVLAVTRSAAAGMASDMGSPVSSARA